MLEIFRPHSHDAADSIDAALESDQRGIRAVKISFAALMVTALVQLLIVVVTSSVALLADTIHNFSDALTAIPLFIAFRLGRRAANQRYTYGYRRAEDLAGLFVLAMIAISAVVAGWQAIDRLIHPRELEHLGVLFAAGLVGFIGNELVALYRIREGHAIGSAALVADGYHARTDGFTSLAVALGAVGVWAGFDRADPIVGLIISIAIFAVLRGAARQVYYRLMDAVTRPSSTASAMKPPTPPASRPSNQPRSAGSDTASSPTSPSTSTPPPPSTKATKSPPPPTNASPAASPTSTTSTSTSTPTKQGRTCRCIARGDRGLDVAFERGGDGHGCFLSRAPRAP